MFRRINLKVNKGYIREEKCPPCLSKEARLPYWIIVFSFIASIIASLY